ncbi:MAG: polysaccharide deacetylase family protein [Vulcanimicrobiota bacterium]
MRGLLFFVLLSLAAVARPARELPVLCYHQVAPARMGDDMVIDPETFEAHLQYLKRNGYHSLSLRQAQQFLWGRIELPEHPVLITFDDGYQGVYRSALPLLRKYHQRAVVFLVVGHIGDKKAATPHLSLAELRALKASGLIEFGSHTYDLHVLIPERLAGHHVYPAQILADLKKSRSELKRLLGVDAQALAWPYGHYNRLCTQLGARAGFRCQFTTDYGRNRPFQGTSRIRRIRVSANSNDVATLDWKLRHPELSKLP